MGQSRSCSTRIICIMYRIWNTAVDTVLQYSERLLTMLITPAAYNACPFVKKNKKNTAVNAPIGNS